VADNLDQIIRNMNRILKMRTTLLRPVLIVRLTYWQVRILAQTWIIPHFTYISFESILHVRVILLLEYFAKKQRKMNHIYPDSGGSIHSKFLTKLSPYRPDEPSHSTPPLETQENAQNL
jgi:hypothetical protein